jgi:hypothetical protein
VMALQGLCYVVVVSILAYRAGNVVIFFSPYLPFPTSLLTT